MPTIWHYRYIKTDHSGPLVCCAWDFASRLMIILLQYPLVSRERQPGAESEVSLIVEDIVWNYVSKCYIYHVCDSLVIVKKVFSYFFKEKEFIYLNFSIYIDELLIFSAKKMFLAKYLIGITYYGHKFTIFVSKF